MSTTSDENNSPVEFVFLSMFEHDHGETEKNNDTEKRENTSENNDELQWNRDGRRRMEFSMGLG
jgi:hypothetical protein